MEQFLLSLLRHIAYNFPQLSLVAEDCGQLDTQEDNYPVTFPCVLVGNTDISWTDLDEQGSSQRGTATITVRLAIDCYDDVHIGSTQESSIADRYRLATDLHKSLQSLEFDNLPDIYPLTRQRSRDYTLPGNIKIYESLYTFLIYD